MRYTKTGSMSGFFFPVGFAGLRKPANLWRSCKPEKASLQGMLSKRCRKPANLQTRLFGQVCKFRWFANSSNAANPSAQVFVLEKPPAARKPANLQTSRTCEVYGFRRFANLSKPANLQGKGVGLQVSQVCKPVENM